MEDMSFCCIYSVGVVATELLFVVVLENDSLTYCIDMVVSSSTSGNLLIVAVVVVEVVVVVDVDNNPERNAFVAWHELFVLNLLNNHYRSESDIVERAVSVYNVEIDVY